MSDASLLSSLFIADTPLLDVRAPVEYDQGHFPQSVNLPLLDDEQRKLVGMRYKAAGQDAAIELGWSLASEELREQKQKAWLAWLDANPDGVLYCFRGGLRSRLSQQLIGEAGRQVRCIPGGYKAMRTFLLAEIARASSELPLVLVSGRTGVGKTRLLRQLPNFIDLEKRACHRGSAFGALIGRRPVQISFENAVAVDMLKNRHVNAPKVFVEDEGRLIGRVHLPLELQVAMKAAPLVVLETDIDTRIDNVLKDYVTDNLASYRASYGASGFKEFGLALQQNLARIQKRLGGALYKSLSTQLADALDALIAAEDQTGFREIIRCLLEDYYDPMYDYQLERRQGTILERGNMNELLHWAALNGLEGKL